MSQMKALDKNFPIQRRLEIEAAPIVLVNVFTVRIDDEVGFSNAWQADAGFMKHQPGLISTQFHRATGESPTSLNYAARESTATFRAAFTLPDFVAKFSAYPPFTVAAPHLFQKVGVSGICTS